MKRAEIVLILITCMFCTIGVTTKTRRVSRFMTAREADKVLGGQPANCWKQITQFCPGQSGNCSDTIACQNNQCPGAALEYDPSQPSYQDAAPALAGWSDEMIAEGLYCQIFYHCNCKINSNGVNACNKIEPGEYQTYRQPYTVTGSSCPGS